MRKNRFAPPELFAVVTVTAFERPAQAGADLSIASYTLVSGQRARRDSICQADPPKTGVTGTSIITASAVSPIPFDKTSAAAPGLLDRMTRRAIKFSEIKTRTDGPAVNKQFAGLAGLLSLQ